MDDLKKLILKSKKGDNDAFEKIVEENLNLISIIAKKHKQIFPNINLNDLISEGIYGLFQGIKHYNSRKCVKFSTYIQFWIKKYIRKYIIENSTIIKVPYNILRNIKKVLSLVDKDRYITYEKISRELNLDLDNIKELLVERLRIKKELSLDRYLDESEEQETLYEVIPDKTGQNLENLVQQKEIENYVYNLLDKLTYEESEIIKWRYGIKDSKHHTIKDVAQKLGLSSQKVKELEELALLKLKALSDKDDEDISS